MRVRKIPVEVDAIQFTGDNALEIRQWMYQLGERAIHYSDEAGLFWDVAEEDRIDDEEIVAEVYDKLHSTWVGVKVNDYIVRGVQGEFYPVNSEVFWTTYETVNSPS